jgi:hypothetical protein
MLHNDSAPYPGGGQAYSNNSGASFGAEANRSLKFSASVSGRAVSPANEVPAGFSRCAGEGGFCSFSGTAMVAYGAGAYVYRAATNGISCGASQFGGDPIAGVAKACYARVGGPNGYGTPCAAENGTCSFSGFQTAAYGATGRFVYKSFTTSTSCTTAAFGSDPIAGVAKNCYLTP